MLHEYKSVFPLHKTIEIIPGGREFVIPAVHVCPPSFLFHHSQILFLQRKQFTSHTLLRVRTISLLLFQLNHAQILPSLFTIPHSLVCQQLNWQGHVMDLSLQTKEVIPTHPRGLPPT
jgi:hypothetical protein